MYRRLVFIHIVGAFGFILVHGTTTSIMFRPQNGHDPRRIEALLVLARSKMVNITGSVGFLLMGASGIALGFFGKWRNTGWLCTPSSF